MDNSSQTDAKRAGQQVMRRHTLTMAGLLAAFELCLIVVLVVQYRRLDQQDSAAIAEQLTFRAAILSTRTAVAIQQLERSRDSMENALFSDSVEPRGAPIDFDRVIDAERSQRPVGTYWFPKTRNPKLSVEVVGDLDLSSKINDSEVRAALGAAREFPADHSSNPMLFRSSYISARNGFIVFVTPADHSIASDFSEMWRRDKSVTIASILQEIGGNTNPMIIAAAKSYDHDVHWLTPYTGDGVAFLQLALTAYVYQGKLFRGTMMKQFLATDLLATETQLAGNPASHFYVVTEDGHFVDLAQTKGLGVQLIKTTPAWLKRSTALAMASRGKLVSAEQHQAIMAPIAGTPWHLLLVAPTRSIAAKLFTDLLPTVLAIVGLAIGSMFALIGYRRSFLLPAISLLERAQSAEDPSRFPSIGRMWNPWLDVLDKGKRDAARFVRSLEEQGDLRNAILASAIDGIITSNEAGVITDINPAAEAMFGWSRDDIIGRKMEDTIVPPAFQAKHVQGMARYISEGEAVVIGRKVELQGLRKGGDIFPMELAIAEARVGGARIFIGYVHDLSEQHRTQAELVSARDSLHQSEKLTALGSLLAGVAHELNNPLAIVVGRAAILEEKLADTPYLAPIQKLRAAADRCSRIVKTFLAMARQSGPRRSTVQLNDLVEGALDMTAYGLRTDGVTVCQELDPALPTTEADEDQLVQVMINLIVNAQHAMAGKRGVNSLTLRTLHDARANSVIIEVMDTGPGMPRNIATRVFDPFFTTKDVGAGTGIGLSVSRGMIEAHGGTLALAANSAKGATFRVTLPILSAAALHSPVSSPALALSRRGRILIVDDEAEVAALLVECLTPLDIICDVASDGQDALNRIAANRYDGILTDLRMPGMDGIALHRRLQADHPALAARLAYISGDVLHNDAARIAAIGDRPIIEKPFDPQLVREVALKLLATGDKT